MKNISKNIVLITLLIIVNLAIFLFCKILTDEGNFIWSKTEDYKRWMVSLACQDLMRTKYFIYANSINFLMLGIYFGYYYRKTLGFIIFLLGILIFWGGNKLFEKEIVENYYIVFKHQKVPDDFILEPIKSAGENIGPLLMEDIQNKISPHRQSAIQGIGEIKYSPAVETLNTILQNLKEKPEIRGEAYLALIRINTEKSMSYARIFMASIHPVADQATLDYIKSHQKGL